MPKKPPRQKPDELDFSRIDLDAIDAKLYQNSESSNSFTLFKQIFFGVLLLGLGFCLYWLPKTNFYKTNPLGDALFFTICLLAIVFGFLLGRFIFRIAEESAKRYAETYQPKALEPDKPPSAFQRWLTLGVALVGGIIIIAGSPIGGYFANDGNYQGNWYLTTLGAIIVGTLLGRWLYLHANRPHKGPPIERKPIVLPPWLKWVNLALLIAGGLAAAIGGSFLGDLLSEEARFGIGGFAFVLGVFFAIWLIRRFDEEEKRLTEKAKRTRQEQ